MDHSEKRQALGAGAGVGIVLCFAVLLLGARRQFPHPRELEIGVAHVGAKGITRRFWVYAVGAGLIAAGYVDFPFIALRFARARSARDKGDRQ